MRVVKADASSTFTIVVTTLVVLGCSEVRGSPAEISRRPAYVECVSSDECAFDSCCVLGMGRYSIPHCQKKLQLYESCRPPSDEPVNSTVTYPDGSVVSLYNVHMIMCPCADGLRCDSKLAQCADFDGAPSHNNLHENIMMED